MKYINIVIAIISLNIFSHGTTISSEQANLILKLNNDLKLLEFHSHDKEFEVNKIQAGYSSESIENVDKDEFFQSQKDALPVGLFVTEFKNSLGDVVFINAVKPTIAYASHYDGKNPEPIDDVISVPIQVPYLEGISSLRVYKKISDKNYYLIEAFDISMKLNLSERSVPSLLRPSLLMQ
jgi:hypothetical protein